MFRILRLAFALFLVAATVRAGPLHSGNVALLGDAPRSLRDGQLESNSTAFLFQERSFVSTSAYSGDIGGFGSGVAVQSWYLHYDPVGSQSIVDPGEMGVRFSFESAILGVDLQSATLDAGDAMFGALDTEYRFGEELRGLEVDNHDLFRLEDDGHTIVFDLKVWHGNTDGFRVFTTGQEDLVPNPEPGTLVLFGAALGAAAYLRRRRSA